MKKNGCEAPIEYNADNMKAVDTIAKLLDHAYAAGTAA